MQVRCWIVVVRYTRDGGTGELGGVIRSVPLTLTEAWAKIREFRGHEAVIECDEELLARANAEPSPTEQTFLV
jgi:hypothetical protein